MNSVIRGQIVTQVTVDDRDIKSLVSHPLRMWYLLLAGCLTHYWPHTTNLQLIPESVLLGALQFSSFLGQVNSAINPILYFFIDKKIRKRMEKVLKGKYGRKKVRRQSKS